MGLPITWAEAQCSVRVILFFLAFDSVVSLIATSVKLSSPTSLARAYKLSEGSTFVLILLFVAFDSVVSLITTSVKLSSSILSSRVGITSRIFFA